MPYGIPEADDLADYLGVDVEDERAETLIGYALEQVRNYTGLTLTPVFDDVQVIAGTVREVILLSQYPVLEDFGSGGDLEVTVSDSSNEDPETIDATDYLVHADSGMIRRLPIGQWWGRDIVINVTYSHGFEELPDDIRSVILGLAGRLYTTSTGGEITQETIGNYSVTYAQGTTGPTFEAGEVRILDRYRNRSLA